VGAKSSRLGSFAVASENATIAVGGRKKLSGCDRWVGL
jgi:hypothetical protein